MRMGRQCLVCGHSIIIDKCYSPGKRKWMSRLQRVKVSPGSWRLGQGNVYDRGGVEVFHVACWSVVKTVFGPEHDFDDALWLVRFRDTSYSLCYWMDKLESIHAPELLDDYKFEDAIQSSGNGEGCLDRFRLSAEIVQIIYSHLSDWRDVVNLMDASLTSPSPGQILSLGRKYLLANNSPLKSEDKETTLGRVKCLLWNLQKHPKSFPHTLNYEVIWNNVELLRGKLDKSLHGTTPGTQVSGPSLVNTVHSTTFADRWKEKTITISSLSKLSLYFTHIAEQRYLSGLGFDCQQVGYAPDSSITISVSQFRGLALVSDNTGFTGVKVKDGEHWSPGWYGVYPETYVYSGKVHDSALEPTFLQIAWPAEGTVSLNLYLNSFNIQHFTYAVHPQIEDPPLPCLWRTRFPSTPDIPTPLVDLSAGRDRTFSFIGEELNSVDSITAFLDATGFLQCFNFFSNGKRIGRIGDSGDQSYAPLDFVEVSFRLSTDRGEVITGVACAPREGVSRPSLGIMFLTSCGRAIHFGGGSNWRPSWCPKGIFGSGQVPRRHYISPMRTFGVFKDELEPEAEVQDLSSFEHIYPQRLCRGLTPIKLEGNNTVNALISEVDLTTVTKVTVYTKSVDGEAYICGMTVFHSDDDYDTSILGETGVEAKTFELDGNIRNISFYYTIQPKTQYQIKGLRFGLGTSNPVSVGSLEAPKTETLHFPRYGVPMLFWAYKSYFSYLSTDPTFEALSGSTET